MISEQRAKVPRGSYGAQRCLAIEEADEIAESAKNNPNKYNLLLATYAAKAVIHAKEIAVMALCKTPMRTEQFIANQVRLFGYIMRIYDFPNLGELMANWPQGPEKGIANIIGKSSLEIGLQFVQMIRLGVNAFNQTTGYNVNYYVYLQVCPNPDPVFTEWMEFTIRKLKENTLRGWKMWEIRRDADSLLYKLEDEYQRSLKNEKKK